MTTVVLPTRGLVLMPGMLRVVSVGRPASIAAIDAHADQGEVLVTIPQIDPEEEHPLLGELPDAGCIAQLLRITRLPDGTVRVLLEGQERVRRTSSIRKADGVLRCEVEPLVGTVHDPVALGAEARELAELHMELSRQHSLSPTEHWTLAASPDDPEHLIDQSLTLANATLQVRIDVLGEPSIDNRMAVAIHELSVAVARARIREEVHSKVQQAMDDSQREYQLREQLKVLRKELAKLTGSEDGTESFAERIEAAAMPDEVRAEALKEADRLTRMAPETAEYTMLRTWLETVCDIPWNDRTEDKVSLAKAQRVLDRDHHGLDKVKERILEYLAVRQLNPESTGPILCFAGPPGVGKTSLGRSIAAALGRSFGRMALGGVKDETEIRGHRRTYVGALPGRLLRALIRAGTSNPVIVLDELDKVGNDFRGDPASALLEVLDPEQNGAFVDHYVDVPVDLSQVLFIATANLIDTIPPALLDRLEVIEIPGYTEEEKVTIGRKHLLPRLAQRHGLNDGQISVQTKALRDIVRNYTREAGLRNLERELASLHRKVARDIVEKKAEKVRVTPQALQRYLGPVRFHNELAEEASMPGVVVGLAWTAAGGDILFVEATRMPGTRSLKLTGSLGDVMKESAEAAMSWLRSHALTYGVAAEAFDGEFHLHVPAGAIPKDGPSAGVTMVSALASVVTGRPIRPQLAMTGEITLRGKVLPVGGVKEKALAARRAGVKTILLPRHNLPDLEDVHAELRKDLTFVPLDTIDDVLEHALA